MMHKIQQIPANLRIHDCRSKIMFNRSFYSSLCSRRLEVVGVRKNEGARERQGGEGAPARKAHAWIVSRPQSSWQPLRDLSKILTENEWPRTNKACRQESVVHFIFLKIANSLFSLRGINLTLGLTPPRRHLVWRDSVGVESSRSGLKSECADFFRQSFLWLLRHTDESQKGRNSCLWLQSRSVLSLFGVV